jgi:rubrerythrin
MQKLKHQNRVKRILKQIAVRHSTWVCSCGYQVPKANAELSGYDFGSRGFHVHCPRCGKVVAEFLDPK